MTTATSAAELRLTLTSSAEQGVDHTGFNLHMLSPIMVGLTIPMLVVGFIDPSSLQQGRSVLFMLLAAIFVLTTILFGLSLLWQGELTAVIFHNQQRKIEFVQSGLLANTSSDVTFDQVVTIGIASRFDEDGYPYSQAEIQLRDGQRIALPAGVTSEMIAAARRALGF